MRPRLYPRHPLLLFKTRERDAFLTLHIFFCLYLPASFDGMLIAFLPSGLRFE